MNEGNRVPPVDGPEGAAGETPADRTADAEGAVPEATGAAGGDFELAKPAAVPPAGAEGEEAVAAGEPAWAAPAERPKPLHDPDPYGTPPYGEPGPWAPAPPVQHPAATPAHGTAVPAPAGPPAAAPTAPLPAPTATAPAPAPHVPGPAPAPEAPAAPAPTATAPAPTPMTPAPPPAPGSPAVAGSGPQAADPWGRYDPWAAASAEEQARSRGPLQQTGAGVPTEQQRKKSARRILFAWTLVVALVSAGIGGAAGAYVQREGIGGGVRLPQAGSVPAGRAPDSVAGIAARALPSVVTLHVRGDGRAGTGTGFVLDTEGHILTNNHVVEPAGTGGEISVTFSSGDTVKAKVVGRDSGYDLAVVQVRGVRGLTPLPLGNSDDVKVGDPVVAIGAPFDLANTVTSGIISAKERPITAGGEKSDGSDVSYVDALQTDAPINPGNSGGPLLDSQAQVIGINSAIRSAGSGSGSEGAQAGSIGLGFAIPVNQAKRVAEELINDGHATHPVIGVTLDMGYTGDGARIDSKSAGGGPAVAEGGPGERAGLRAGDVITEVGGERVHNGEELIVKIRAHRPGDRLRLTVERDGTEREVSLVLGASEQN
ncbi:MULTISPECIES: S1C family serine protease [Streptomyces]|uniref:S1C family serine protease n=1 Tax=Streptomyces TaxID=1883 RepID=UPI000B963188|nr:trypsin-like peptidase domain-containing protein [Streptomyces sp. FBKL.4005]OYP15541.1 protease [Streptomyces sp. FBKL.4005]